MRIDNWPSDSQYPNGHLVKVLGPIGDLETEIAALLAEQELTTSAFTPAQVICDLDCLQVILILYVFCLLFRLTESGLQTQHCTVILLVFKLWW